MAAAHHRIAVLERELERMRTLRAAAGGEFDPRAVLAEIAADIADGACLGRACLVGSLGG